MGHQESFCYSFVARGTMVLAEYSSDHNPNLGLIAGQSLQKLPSSNNRFIYPYENHVYNFLVEDGYAYCAVAKESVGKQLSMALLERIKSDFVKRYGGGKADTAAGKSLDREFGAVMKEHMRYVTEHREEMDKLTAVQAQVTQVQNIMRENITKTIERGEGLNILNDKADGLRDSAAEFKKIGREIRRKMWYENMKIKVVVIGILVLLALVIWLSVCRGFDCTN